MKTKSNLNPLIIIISLALLLFLAALLWRTFINNDNSEQINTPSYETPTKVQNKPKEVIEDTINVTDKPVYTTREEYKMGQSKALNMGMLYNTPEKVMDAILKLQKSGDTDKADQMIEYLLKNFPEYEMEEEASE